MEAGQVAVLICRLGDMPVAFRAASVARVLPVPRLSRPPGTPAPVAGFAHTATGAMPVVRLDRLLGIGNDDAVDLYAHLIELEGGAPHLALLVDRADRFATVDPAALRPFAADASPNGVIAAEFDRDGAPVSLLDADRLLLAEERVRLQALAAAATTRAGAWHGA